MSEQTQTPEDLSPEELERIVADFVARDGPGPGDLPADVFFALWEQEESAELQPEFAASLRRSLEQARSGEGVDLKPSENSLDDERLFILTLEARVAPCFVRAFCVCVCRAFIL